MRYTLVPRLTLATSILLAGLLFALPVAAATSADTYESDDTLATASSIALGESQQRSIYPAADIDWVEIQATEGTLYRLETARPAVTDSTEPELCTDLELWDSSGTVLLASDYDGAGRYGYSRIVWTAPATGTYHLRVRGVTEFSTGPYALRVLGDTGLRYLRGTVTADDGGAPLPDIWVGAYNELDDLVGTCRTQADGAYAVPLFYDDTYRVEFDDRNDVYIGEHHDDALYFGDATYLDVGPAGITGIDAGLATGAEISGTVTDQETGLPLEGIEVSLHTEGLFSDIPRLVTKTTTEADGSYRFGGLPAAEYVVGYYDRSDELYVPEYYDDVVWEWPYAYGSGTFADATWLDIALGESVASVDASLAPYPLVTGRVVDEYGSPIESVDVWIEEASPQTDGGHTIECGKTAPDGTYSARVSGPDAYTVRFSPNGDYLGEYYDDVSLAQGDSATVLTISEYGETLAGIDATLAPAGKISGTLVVGGESVSGVIEVWQKVGEELQQVTAPNSTDPAGVFTIGGLPTGDYYLRVQDDGTQIEWSGDAPSQRFATPVHVTAGSTTTGIDFDLLADPYRAAGPDRYATAVASSKATFAPGQCETVVLVSGVGFADAMSASGLAGSVGGSILLVRPDAAPAVVLDEIERLGATSAYIVGGADVVSDNVRDQVDALPGMATPARIAGRTRYETSAEVVAEVATLEGVDFSHAVFVARGDLFPDALAAGPFAYSQRMPILLVKPNALPAAIGEAIESLDITSTIICGDVVAVSSAVEAEIEALNGAQTTAMRLGGDTRYDTAAAIVTYGDEQGWCDSRVPTFGYATGTNFPDALSGASALGARDGGLLLVKPTVLPSATRRVVEEYLGGPKTIILGGTSAVGQKVMDAIEEAADPWTYYEP